MHQYIKVAAGRQWSSDSVWPGCYFLLISLPRLHSAIICLRSVPILGSCPVLMFNDFGRQWTPWRLALVQQGSTLKLNRASKTLSFNDWSKFLLHSSYALERFSTFRRSASCMHALAQPSIVIHSLSCFPFWDVFFCYMVPQHRRICKQKSELIVLWPRVLNSGPMPNFFTNRQHPSWL